MNLNNEKMGVLHVFIILIARCKIVNHLFKKIAMCEF